MERGTIPHEDIDLSVLAVAPTVAHNSSSEQTRIAASRGWTSSQRVLSTGSGASSRSIAEEQALTEEELDTKPWKFIGYRGYSSYLAAETDFLIFRRFRVTSVRVMLRLQDKVAALEDKLGSLDSNYERRECKDVNNGTLRNDNVKERDLILDELKIALDEYYAFILQQTELKNLPPAPNHDIESVRNWHYNHKSAINENEQSYLINRHDLFALLPRIKSPLRRLLERSEVFRLWRPWRKLTSDSTLPVYDKKEFTHISDRRVDKCVDIVVVAIGIAMLVGPIWILNGLNGQKEKLATITAFVVLFLGIVGGATVAKIWEALAATAAYSAVLMVFMQLGTAEKS